MRKGFEEAQCIFHPRAKKHPYLQASDRINHFPGPFSVVSCSQCALKFQDPRPDREHIGDYYPAEGHYFTPPTTKRNKHLVKLEKEILAQYFGYTHLAKRNIFKKMLLWVPYLYLYRDSSIPRFIPQGRVLDIGCSYGSMLDLLAQYGWLVSGIEPSQKAARIAQEKHRNVRYGMLEKQTYAKNSFDVIILSMVLEHLHDPKEAIALARKWLKPGGQLIFSIPYIDGFEGRLFKEYYYSLHLPVHIYFPAKKHILLLLKGWKDISFHFHCFDRDFVASATYLNGDKPRWYLRIINNKLLRYVLVKPSIFLLALMGKTSRVTVRARK